MLKLNAQKIKEFGIITLGDILVAAAVAKDLVPVLILRLLCQVLAVITAVALAVVVPIENMDQQILVAAAVAAGVKMLALPEALALLLSAIRVKRRGYYELRFIG